MRIQIRVSVAITIEHLLLKGHIILMSLTCRHLSATLLQLSHRAHYFQKDVIKYEICVLVSSKTCLEKFKFQKELVKILIKNA